MDDDCKDLYTGGLIKRYTKRPVSVEHVTITDWAVWYDCETKSYVKPSTELNRDSLLLENTIDDLNDDNQPSENKTPNKNRKRTKARVIRSVWFNQQSEPKKHYHELIMLFTALQNEGKNLLGNFSF